MDENIEESPDQTKTIFPSRKREHIEPTDIVSEPDHKNNEEDSIPTETITEKENIPPTDRISENEEISPTDRISDNEDSNEQDLEETHHLGDGNIQQVLKETLTQKPEDKYDLKKTIGRGGMKTVFKVKDRDTARNIAMAVISDEEDISDNDIARFIKEARITANLEHPNIVPVHDIGVDKDGSPYFTMKMVEGEALADIVIELRDDNSIYHEKYNLSQLLQIFQKICNAIDFAHSKGIVHLDLKPGNIEVGDFGDVLVLDWGLAKHIEEDGTESYDHFYSHDLDTLRDIAVHDMGNTMDGEVKGTPGYMAPEQAAGLNTEKDKLTDIYSLGAILYNILTLKKPISGTDVYDILDKTIDGELVRPSERCPDRYIPRALEAITMKAMSVKPEDRYQNVRELLADVDAFISGFATVAEEAGFIRQCNLYIKRNKALSFFASFAIIVSLGLAGFWITNELKHYAAWGKANQITPISKNMMRKQWVIQNGNWKVENGKLVASTGKGDSFRIFFNKSVYGNIALEFDAMVESKENLKKSGDLSVIFSGDKVTRKGYYLQLGGVSNSSAVIQKNGALLASKKFKLEANRKYHIRAEKEGEQLRLFCDGKLIISARDIFYSEGGYVGLYTFGEGKQFWNIKLYSKGVPELVSPLDLGDGFYRASRAPVGDIDKRLIKAVSSSSKIKTKNDLEKLKHFKSILSDDIKKRYLKLARESYDLVYNSYPNKAVGLQALLKRSYVDLELGNIVAAKIGAVKLGELAPSLDQVLLKAELAFRSGEYLNAYNCYAFAVAKHPEASVGTVGVLMSKLADRNIIKKIDSELLMRFWRMYAQNQSNSILRCSNKFLSSLKFVEGLDLNLIDCSQNFITSLKPLKGMNLKRLDCADNDIESLAPLKGMKLETLECFNNPRITSLEPLRGMPLKVLAISGCPNIKSIDPILSLTTLERLSIPKGIKGIEKLRGLKNLKYLSYNWEDRNRTVEQFWADYDKRK